MAFYIFCVVLPIHNYYAQPSTARREIIARDTRFLRDFVNEPTALLVMVDKIHISRSRFRRSIYDPFGKLYIPVFPKPKAKATRIVGNHHQPQLPLSNGAHDTVCRWSPSYQTDQGCTWLHIVARGHHSYSKSHWEIACYRDRQYIVEEKYVS